jgi:hypothetical protein
MVFETAHAADGSIAPAKTLTFPIGAITALKTVVVDTHDRLYALGAGGVYLLDDVSKASGSVSGKAAVAPLGVTFTAIAVGP